MANQFANTANLLLTAIFFHPLLPISIPIATVGLLFNYWANKVIFFFLLTSIDCILASHACPRITIKPDAYLFRKLDPLYGINLGPVSASFLQNLVHLGLQGR